MPAELHGASQQSQTQAGWLGVGALVTLQTRAAFAKELQPEEEPESNKLASRHPQSTLFELSAQSSLTRSGGSGALVGKGFVEPPVQQERGSEQAGCAAPSLGMGKTTPDPWFLFLTLRVGATVLVTSKAHEAASAQRVAQPMVTSPTKTQTSPAAALPSSTAEPPRSHGDPSETELLKANAAHAAAAHRAARRGAAPLQVSRASSRTGAAPHQPQKQRVDSISTGDGHGGSHFEWESTRTPVSCSPSYCQSEAVGTCSAQARPCHVPGCACPHTVPPGCSCCTEEQGAHPPWRAGDGAMGTQEPPAPLPLSPCQPGGTSSSSLCHPLKSRHVSALLHSP